MIGYTELRSVLSMKVNTDVVFDYMR